MIKNELELMLNFTSKFLLNVTYAVEIKWNDTEYKA